MKHMRPCLRKVKENYNISRNCFGYVGSEPKVFYNPFPGEDLILPWWSDQTDLANQCQSQCQCQCQVTAWRAGLTAARWDSAAYIQTSPTTTLTRWTFLILIIIIMIISWSSPRNPISPAIIRNSLLPVWSNRATCWGNFSSTTKNQPYLQTSSSFLQHPYRHHHQLICGILIIITISSDFQLRPNALLEKHDCYHWGRQSNGRRRILVDW